MIRSPIKVKSGSTASIASVSAATSDFALRARPFHGSAHFVTRSGAFEPVATLPNHQRRGLGKAVMCEGLRRLKRMGATQARVGSYSESAGRLYASAGFTQYELCEEWCREI